MAKKPSAGEKPRTLLPCISEDELLNNPSLSQVSKPKSSSRRRVNRVNSDANVPNEEQVKNASGKNENGGEDGKGKMLSSNRKKVLRRGSVPQGLCNSSDVKATFKEAAAKVRRASKKNIQPDKPPSPDIIDLSNEKVVQELLLRLYETLRLTEKETLSPVEQNDFKTEESRKTELNLSSKSENTMKFHRQNAIRFPQLNQSTPNLKVFYSKPVSWKCLKSRQLQRRKRPTNFFTFQDSLTRSDQLGTKELFNRQVSRMTWFYGDFSPPGTSRPVLHDRGFSVPLLMRHSNALVKTSFGSPKSVTFAV